MAGAPGRGCEVHYKGPRHLWCGPGLGGTRDAAGAEHTLTSRCLGCEGMKAKGLLFRGPSSETPARLGVFLISYCTKIKLF